MGYLLNQSLNGRVTRQRSKLFFRLASYAAVASSSAVMSAAASSAIVAPGTAGVDKIEDAQLAAADPVALPSAPEKSVSLSKSVRFTAREKDGLETNATSTKTAKRQPLSKSRTHTSLSKERDTASVEHKASRSTKTKAGEALKDLHLQPPAPDALVTTAEEPNDNLESLNDETGDASATVQHCSSVKSQQRSKTERSMPPSGCAYSSGRSSFLPRSASNASYKTIWRRNYVKVMQVIPDYRSTHASKTVRGKSNWRSNANVKSNAKSYGKTSAAPSFKIPVSKYSSFHSKAHAVEKNDSKVNLEELVRNAVDKYLPSALKNVGDKEAGDWNFNSVSGSLSGSRTVSRRANKTAVPSVKVTLAPQPDGTSHYVVRII